MPHTAHSEPTEELEDALRKRVQTARERYLAAVSQTERAAGDQANLTKRDAMVRYLAELRVFSDLVLRRRIPREGR